jgi:hypothetical protein
MKFKILTSASTIKGRWDIKKIQKTNHRKQKKTCKFESFLWTLLLKNFCSLSFVTKIQNQNQRRSPTKTMEKMKCTILDYQIRRYQIRRLYNFYFLSHKLSTQKGLLPPICARTATKLWVLLTQLFKGLMVRAL